MRERRVGGGGRGKGGGGLEESSKGEKTKPKRCESHRDVKAITEAVTVASLGAAYHPNMALRNEHNIPIFSTYEKAI